MQCPLCHWPVCEQHACRRSPDWHDLCRWCLMGLLCYQKCGVFMPFMDEQASQKYMDEWRDQQLDKMGGV